MSGVWRTLLRGREMGAAVDAHYSEPLVVGTRYLQTWLKQCLEMRGAAQKNMHEIMEMEKEIHEIRGLIKEREKKRKLEALIKDCCGSIKEA